MAKIESIRRKVTPKPHPANQAKLADLIRVINHGRSKVYIAAQALDHGETDLELQRDDAQ